MKLFTIEARNLSWLEGSGETDLCLHGDATATIGARTLTYDCTVSSTALYLLKSLTEDHALGQDNQMLPCCGHFLIPDEKGENVTIIGCNNGEDWAIRHIEGAVELRLEDGYTVTVPMDEYRREVLAFVQKIEDFYHAHPRKLPRDKFELDGYTAFWKEWYRRKEQPCPTS